MQINREAVARSVLLGLVLLFPVALGVILVHSGFTRWASQQLYLMLQITVVVLWLYGLIEAKSKHGWTEVVVVALAMPLFYVMIWYGTPTLMSERSGVSPIAFLPWLAVISLLSAHLHSRRLYCALAACLLVTAFVTTFWYEVTVLWRLRGMFG